MRAAVCHDWGEPESLSIEDMPEPEMTEGGVRIAVKAAGVNFADTLMIKGEYQVRPPFPFSPGLEVGGEVLECAPGVTQVKPRDKVMAMVPFGGCAEQVIAPEVDVFRVPDAMDEISAAAFPVVYGTSHIGLKDKLNLQPGEVLLVNGAAGGVGLTAVEIAKKMGATVIAAAGGAAHLAGVVAAHTVLPVLGVPMNGWALDGLDSLLATVQMPRGIPVGTLAIGKAGAINAALLAVSILGAKRPELRDALRERRRQDAEKILAETLE